MLAFLDWTDDPAKMGADACGKVWCLSVQKTELERAVTLRLGNDETLRTSTLAILPLVIARVNVVWRVHVVAGGAPLMLSKGIPETSRLPHSSGSWSFVLSEAGCSGRGDKQTVTALASTSDKCWSART